MGEAMLRRVAGAVGVWITLAACGGGGGGGGGVPSTFSISGTVIGARQGAELRLSGAKTATTTADAGGAYAFTGLAAGSYAVEVWDWVCEPGAKSLTVSSADLTGQDFACGPKCVDLPYAGNISVPSSATVDGKSWFFGSSQNNTFNPTVRAFDVSTSTWSTASVSMPYGFGDASGGVAQYAAGHFYVTPGFTASETNGWGSHNRIIDVDVAAGTATEGATVPYGGAIWDMLSGSAGGKIYLVGGHNGSDQLGIFEYVPGAATMTRVATMTYAHRVGKVTLGGDGMLYIMGQSAQIERFDPVHHTVATLTAQLPAEAVGFGGISIIWHVPSESAIYFTPGIYTGSRQNPRVYRLDYAADSLADTGAVVPAWVAGNSVWNVGFMDGRFPHVAFYVQGSGSTPPYQLCRIRLPTL